MILCYIAISQLLISFYFWQYCPPSRWWTGWYLTMESHSSRWAGRHICRSSNISTGGGWNQTYCSELPRTNIQRVSAFSLHHLQKWRTSGSLQGLFPHSVRYVLWPCLHLRIIKLRRRTVVKYFYSALKVHFFKCLYFNKCFSLENFYFTTFQSIILYFLLHYVSY